MAQLNFNAADHAAQMNREALPKGWYHGHIIESEIAQTQKGGQMLNFVVEIDAPPFAKGRKVFPSYNIVNANEDTVRIAYEQLAGLSIAAGLPQWSQTEQLHNRPFQIKLRIEKAPEGSDYEDRNQPNGYDSMSVNRALASQPMATGAAPMAAAFPGAAAPVFAAPVVPGAAAPVAAAPAPVTAPIQQAAPAAAAQPWAGAAQPWAAAAAPVQQAAPAPAPVQQAAPAPVEAVKPPEQIAWEAQQAQLALAAQQPAPAQPAPVQQAAPVTDPAAAPWQNQVAQPVQPAAQQAAAAPTVAEPAHPAQAQLPPWQQAAAQ